MKTTLKLIVLLLTLSITSCNGNLNLIDGIDGSGNVVTEKRNIETPFTKIQASTGVEVILEQGSPSEVEVEVDDNLMKYIVTRVENGTLIVKIDGNINTMESAIVRVKTKTIEGLESSSGASIKTINKLSGTSLALKTSSGSTIQADLEYEKVSCESTSGSEIKVSGKALTLDTKSSSGSEIDAKDLAANEITAQSTSGSNTTVNPIVLLNAKASSGSSIDYIKEPKKVIKEETSGGSVSLN
ncbi:head GIN domain-containing protein [Flavobacterium sp.]|uniref:head GIN domain-containing protein n=1 Tax=Flavobacterium sp. TaxID=239 RepID=UPI0035B33D42